MKCDILHTQRRAFSGVVIAISWMLQVAAADEKSILSKPLLPRFEPKGTVFSYKGLRYRPHDDVIAHANTNVAEGINGSGFDLYLNEVNKNFTKAKPVRKFMEAAAFGAGNPALMSPCLFEENGSLYLFVNIGPRLNNTTVLAVAKP